MIFGVISFPGTNCETESIRALEKAGLKTKLILWNEPLASLKNCAGFLLPGGFSYEDRSRSGVIAANDHIIDYLRKEAQQGKPILGICNGAQILVESGLVTDSKTAQISLTINKRIKNNNVLGTGFYHSWFYLKNTASPKKTPFNSFSKLIRMPLAHGEGRFVIPDNLLLEMEKNDQIIFKYCDHNGQINKNYPINPNSSVQNIAAISNKQGNVVAIMPHPERGGFDSEMFFTGIADWIQKQNKKTVTVSEKIESPQFQITAKDSNFNLEFFIEKIITDNEEETVQATLSRQLQKNIKIKRVTYFSLKICLSNNKSKKQATSRDVAYNNDIIRRHHEKSPTSNDFKNIAQKIIETEEIANVNKEKIYVKYENKIYLFQKNAPWQLIKNFYDQSLVYISYHTDILAQTKLTKLIHENLPIASMQSSQAWQMDLAEQTAILNTGILFNPVSMFATKYK